MTFYNLTKVPYPSSPYLENEEKYSPADDLNREIADIGTGLDAKSWWPIKEDWEQVHDYEVQNEGTIFILNPTTKKCLKHLEERIWDEAPRWGTRGFVVEHRYIKDLCDRLDNAGFISKEAERCFQEEALSDPRNPKNTPDEQERIDDEAFENQESDSDYHLRQQYLIGIRD